MTDLLTITGAIGTDPELRTVGQNLQRMTMRVASSERKRDSDGNWRNAHTNWYTVTAFGKLAENAHASLRKGQRVLVAGKLRVQQFDREDGTSGTRVEILANNLGPDLVNQVASSAPPANNTPASAPEPSRMPESAHLQDTTAMPLSNPSDQPETISFPADIRDAACEPAF
ncbi:single-stranded DNA-binding protein [Gulosibacter bifidus]|uniref:Single-stranded DNA-binding protein n=1 Tax=Gulosibacter bifidus TaxID=272239 RepID=A0ABW5RK36_9MICO|nr:single-stranded DNA-binding protein [Gulosibacter bifidus]